MSSLLTSFSTIAQSQLPRHLLFHDLVWTPSDIYLFIYDPADLLRPSISTQGLRLETGHVWAEPGLMILRACGMVTCL